MRRHAPAIPGFRAARVLRSPHPPRRRRGLILPRCRVLLLLPIFLLLELEQSSPPSPRRRTPAAVPRFRAPTAPSPRPPPHPASSSSLPHSPGRKRACVARPPLTPPRGAPSAAVDLPSLVSYFSIPCAGSISSLPSLDFAPHPTSPFAV